MENMSKWYQQIIKKSRNKLSKMTDDDEGNFHEAGECHICNKKYFEKDISVSDHCYIFIIYIIYIIYYICYVCHKWYVWWISSARFLFNF